jgi:hypothetical protein
MDNVEKHNLLERQFWGKLNVFITCMGLSPRSFLLDYLLHKDSAGTITRINM